MPTRDVVFYAFLDELEKISGDMSTFDRATLAAPFVGGAAGGIYGALGHAKDKRARLLSALEGAAAGATIGWAPAVVKDFVTAVRN